jgi:peroxiredoxin
VSTNQNEIAQNQEQQSALPPGTQAPEFTLPSSPDQKASLSDFRGKPVILVFYPADWSPVCGDQLALYNEILPEFKRFNAELLAISVDGVWCHRATGKIAICISRCFRISSRKVKSRGTMASIANQMEYASERFS